jgi:hypothetical protein
MNNFKGFTDSETFTQLPDSFFHHLLKEIKDVDELKVTVYFLWRIEHMDGPFRALCETDFDAKDLGLAADEVASALEKACQRGSLLKSQHDTDTFYSQKAIGEHPHRSSPRRCSDRMYSSYMKKTSVC